MKGQIHRDYDAIFELEIMAHATNYNEWIWYTISPYVGDVILEIGSGIGTFTHFLKDKKRVFATDIAPNCIEVLRNRFVNYRNISISYFNIELDKHVPFTGRDVDTAICLNVLEHIGDDKAALINLNRLMQSGSKLVVMVPACQAAYGTVDELDGHYRRYARREIIEKLNYSRFRIRRCRYFNSIGLFAWYFTNKIARDRETSIVKLKFYDRYIVPILRVTESLISPPFGQSIILVAEKHEDFES